MKNYGSDINDSNFCDCDEDNNCGCSYPNNTGLNSCQYANLHNAECKADIYMAQDQHHYDVCSCDNQGDCDCTND